jgi:sulfide dehydrogenase [flavocytochrome c] flavoprotein subunit
MTIARRGFIKGTLGLSAMAALYGCAGVGKGAKGHVVVVGGGYGGATAAKYISMWSEGSIRVTLVERNAAFVSCPISNLVIAGERQLSDITIGYEGLAKYGITVVQDEVTAVDAEKHMIKLARGGDLAYDRLVLSPGVDFMYEALPGMASAAAKDNVLHAWKAGAQTVALRKQLEDMKDGGVYALSIPKAPYRCPPGPYERACLVANYLQKTKPKSKVLVLDANEEIVSKKGLFTKAFEKYKGILEYRPRASCVRSMQPAGPRCWSSTRSRRMCSTWCRPSVPATSPRSRASS